MLRKTKLFLSVLLIFTMLSGSMVCYAQTQNAGDSSEKEEGYSYVIVNGIWRISSYTNGEASSEYSYDEKGNRIKKTVNGKEYTYDYDNEQRLIREAAEDCELWYLYESLNDRYPYGFRYLGDIFIYEKDVHGNIIGIKSQDGTGLVNYSFDGNWLLTGYVLTEEASGNPNADQIAEANSFLGIGCYYDRETGLYYNGRYYNTVTGTYMGNADDDASVFTRERTEIMPQASVDYAMEADEWSLELLNNGSYGGQINVYSENWYEGLSTLEIIARLLYGENTLASRTPEREAIAWLLLYRMDDTQFPQNLRDIATEAGQFSTIHPLDTEISDRINNTRQARTPDQSSAAWRNATYLACLLMLTNDKGNVYETIGKPAYYTNQVYFFSYRKVYDEGRLRGSGDTLTMEAWQTLQVKDVAIVGVGVFANSADIYTAGIYNIAYPDSERRNVFYNIK